VIVNLQATALDHIAFMRINALCEDVMLRIAKKIELKVKEFIWKRLISFEIHQNNDLTFRGIDQRGLPYAFLRKV
jgi:hypothetical protein